VFPFQSLHVGEWCCTSRRPKTHITEHRTVRYQWHPWYGRSVGVIKLIKRQQGGVFRCVVNEGRTGSTLEIPLWMFDPALCSGHSYGKMPSVDLGALQDLQILLQSVKDHQHHSIPSTGDAEDEHQFPPANTSTQSVSSKADAATVAGSSRTVARDRDTIDRNDASKAPEDPDRQRGVRR